MLVGKGITFDNIRRGIKLAIQFNGITEYLFTIHYCTDCRMGVNISSSNFPGLKSGHWRSSLLHYTFYVLPLQAWICFEH